jgi:hypothetical protein
MTWLVQQSAACIVLYHAYRALRSVARWACETTPGTVSPLDRLIALCDRLAARWRASERARLDMQPTGQVFRTVGVISRINPVYLRDCGDGLMLSVRRTRNQHALLAVHAATNRAALISVHDDAPSAIEACQTATITQE